MSRNRDITLLIMSRKNQVAVYKYRLAHVSTASLKPQENPAGKNPR